MELININDQQGILEAIAKKRKDVQVVFPSGNTYPLPQKVKVTRAADEQGEYYTVNNSGSKNLLVWLLPLIVKELDAYKNNLVSTIMFNAAQDLAKQIRKRNPRVLDDLACHVMQQVMGEIEFDIPRCFDPFFEPYYPRLDLVKG